MTSPVTVSDPVEAKPGQWVSAHVYYRDDLDPLVVEVVAPLVRELASEALTDGFFFIRYWDGGPHLRLRCRATPGSRSAVQARMADRFGRFLAQRPSADTVDDIEYRRYAAVLARAEGVTGYLTRPQPDNSFAFVPYRPEYDRYGHGASLAAVERHFQESSELMLGLLVVGLSPADRATAALAMVLLAWFTAGLDPIRAGRLAAVLAGHGAATDPAHRNRPEPLHRLVGQMRARAARAGELAGSGSFLAWARSVRSLHDTLAGTLHRTEHRTPFSVVDTCAHLACNRLGVGMEQEHRLRYLAAHSVSELDRER